MPHQIGFVDDSGGVLAHYKMLETIKDFASANGWQVLRYKTDVENRELILKGLGYTGEEEIFVGFSTYHDVKADYYNLSVVGMAGYVPGNTLHTQPFARWSGIPCHNYYADYWMDCSPQRIALAIKAGTPVYESGYVGKIFPYATPGQYPYPLAVGGMFNGNPSTRYSETTHSIPYKGNRPNLNLLFNSGAWLEPECWPWNNSYIAGASTQVRDTGGEYALLPVVLSDANGIYGELEGVFHISGFDNVVENTLEINGVTYIVIQDVWRTGFNDYYALRMS